MRTLPPQENPSLDAPSLVDLSRRSLLRLAALSTLGLAAPSWLAGCSTGDGARPNPLLDLYGVPRFDEITPEHAIPAVELLLADLKALIARLGEQGARASWDAFHVPLDDATDRLTLAWRLIWHHYALTGSPAWQSAFEGLQPRVTTVQSEILQDQALFRGYQALRQGPSFPTLPAVRQRIVELRLRDFRLGGAELPAAQRARITSIQEASSRLESRFDDNIRNARDAFAEWVTDEAGLSGLPQVDRDAARAAAAADGRPGWKFTLQGPSYQAVMRYADDRALRERVYRARNTLASESGPPETDNGPVIEELLALLDEEARLLGFDNHAQYRLATRMAGSPEEVLAFLRDLNARVAPIAQRDIADLEAHAGRLGLPSLEPWDRSYVAERLRQRDYDFSTDEVRQYLPAERVLDGLLSVARRLFGVEIKPVEAPVWHVEVRCFQVLRGGSEIGRVYFDLFAREGKPDGGWLDPWRSRHVGTDGLVTPVVFVICNFTPPVPGRPSLLSHDEMWVLFHEMGHCLNVLLTRVDERAVSGLNGVEWDAVEVGSQFMERFIWEWDVLGEIGAHVDTGAPLPRPLFDRVVAARNFQAGLSLAGQIESAVFDIRLHSAYPASVRTVTMAEVLDLAQQVNRESGAAPDPAWARMPNTFSHIFAGGYSAGYYSYLWAEVMAADAFASLRETGSLFDREWGERFVRELLGMGGSRPTADSYRAFRGRAATVDALLADYGLAP